MADGLSGSGSNAQTSMAVAFEGKDSGLVGKLREVFKATEQTDKAFESFASRMKGYGEKIVEKVGSFASKTKGLMSSMTGHIDGMVNSAMNPDIPGDSGIAEFNKAFAAMNVGMNVNGKETEKWRSSIVEAHFKTGESLEGMGKGLTEFRKQGVDVEAAMGKKGLSATMSRMAKIMSVFEIDGAKLAGTFATLKKTFNIDEKAAATLGDRIFTIGKVFNIGREAVQQWPEIVQDLSKEFADLGKKAKPEDIQKYAESIVTLGGALTEGLGKPAEESLALSRQIFGILAGEKKGIQNMFRGMGGEIGALGMQLAETGASADEMFALIQKDPQKFMEGLQKMAKSAEASGGRMGPAFQRLAGTVNTVLGPDVTHLMQANWGKVNDKLKQLPAALSKSGDAMGKAADAAHKFVGSGDPVQAMIAQFQQKTWGLVQTDFKDWFKNLKTGFESTSKTLSKLAAPDSPVSGLTHRLLLMQRVGVSGLFSQSGSTGAGKAFGVIATQATGALGAMQKLGINMSNLPALIGTGGPLLLAFAMFDKGLRKDLLSGLKAASGWMKKEGPGAFKKFKDNIGEVWGDIGPLIDEFVGAFEKAAPDILSGLAGVLSKIDWERGAEKLTGFAVSGADALGTVLVDSIGGFFSEEGPAKSIGSSIGKAMKAAAVGIVKGLWNGLWEQKATLGKNMAHLIVGALAIAMIMSGSVRAMVGSKALSLGKAMFEPIYRAGSVVADKLKAKYNGLSSNMKAQMKDAASGFVGTLVAAYATYAWFRDNMKEETEVLKSEWSDAQNSIGDKGLATFAYLLTAFGKFVDQYTGGHLEKMIGGFDNMTQRMRITWRGLTNIMDMLALKVMRSMDLGWTNFRYGFKLGFADLVMYSSRVWNGMIKMLTTGLGNLLEKFNVNHLLDGIVKGLTDIGKEADRATDAAVQERAAVAGSRMNELASKTSYYDAADERNRKDTLMTADSMNALNVANANKRKAKEEAAAKLAKGISGHGAWTGPSGSAKGRALPSVKSASPVASTVSAQSYSQTSSQMSSQLAQMNMSIANLAARPMVGQVNLDGRKFGQVIFQQQQFGMSQIGGNGAGSVK